MKTFEFDENDIVVDTTCISDTPDDILYFDIETTGLSASRSDLYLIGLGFYDGDHFKTLFLFNDDGCSEPEILAEFADHILYGGNRHERYQMGGSRNRSYRK